MAQELTFPVIKLEKVSKRFKFLLAANNINLDIYKHEVIGFIGPNGAGKSTVLNLIAGVIKPSTGTVFINNIPLAEHGTELKKKTILFSYYSFLYDDLTGLENLEFWFKLYDKDKNINTQMSVKETILQTAEQYGIKNWLLRPVHELSTGMRKKIDFMRAILIEPEFLLLDEPFSGMDPKNISFFRNIIDDYRGKGTTLIVSHNIEILSSLCDRIFIIAKGKISDEINAKDMKDKNELKEKLLSYFDSK